MRLTHSPPFIQNRQPIGNDTELPDSGLLIWHIDEGVKHNDNEGRELVVEERALEMAEDIELQQAGR